MSSRLVLVSSYSYQKSMRIGGVSRELTYSVRTPTYYPSPCDGFALSLVFRRISSILLLEFAMRPFAYSFGLEVCIPIIFC